MSKGIYIQSLDGRIWELIRPPIPIGETTVPEHYVLAEAPTNHHKHTN